jgi:hypothetical protein
MGEVGAWREGNGKTILEKWGWFLLCRESFTLLFHKYV